MLVAATSLTSSVASVAVVRYDLGHRRSVPRQFLHAQDPLQRPEAIRRTEAARGTTQFGVHRRLTTHARIWRSPIPHCECMTTATARRDLSDEEAGTSRATAPSGPRGGRVLGGRNGDPRWARPATISL